MNDEARELLVGAALRGHRQITHRLHDVNADTGECAMGVLHLEAHRGHRPNAVQCGQSTFSASVCLTETADRYGITRAEWEDIVNRNNGTGVYDAPQDFLTIARKVGHED